ncbi:MAG: 16S rRNA (adenine(1518)-N(6)/adenine(1519)-N(6))-dimethyltransferase RsmA [Coriobacteriia bacterium]|nr:16S rRNA (adenine(1518)-N(6)/adenine(1519)-N(6))-dimethyltransferase RsmA [Coriobacteriia bacterium]
MTATRKNVVIVNGSPRKMGNSAMFAERLKKDLMSAGVTSVQIFSPVTHDFRFCMGCERCIKAGECVHTDDMETLAAALDAADALIWLCPLYFGTVPAQLKVIIDRFQLLWARNVLAGEDKGIRSDCTRPALAYYISAKDDPFGTEQREAAALLPLRYASNTAGFALTEHYALVDPEKPGDIRKPELATKLADAIQLATDNIAQQESSAVTNSPLATPTATIKVLQTFDLYTKKRLGQHFLVDDNVIGRILDAADLNKDDQVLEIGPGIGVLTLALLKQAEQVLALEYDSQLVEVLEHTAGSDSKLTIINEDALNIPSIMLPFLPTKLVANLPYQVAATNVLDCFEYLPSVQQATVMVQREVAQRMAAHPGSKAYGAYSAKLQLLAQPTGSFPVSRNSFLPPPRVDSTVITLTRHKVAENLVRDIAHYREVAALIDICFANRRKTILNNLRAADIDIEVAHFALEKTEIDSIARAETLAPKDFVALLDAFRQI